MTKLQDPNLELLQNVAKACILALVAWIGLLIVRTSFSYFPPQFEFGFLRGREPYFFSWYAIVFYTHVISASLGLFVGLLQSIHSLRRRSIRFHRLAGKLYVYLVLFLAAPSGLAMALKASGSWIALFGFATLAVLTAWTTWMGAHHIRRGDVTLHQVWMTRSYLLMCSAVTLRFIAAVTNEFQLGLSYDAMAWLSWLPQLLIYEIASARKCGVYRVKKEEQNLEFGQESGRSGE